jgi:hypothetical protein
VIAGRTLLPIQHIVKAQIPAPLALLFEVAMRLRSVDPNKVPALINEVMNSPRFMGAIRIPSSCTFAADQAMADQEQDTRKRNVVGRPYGEW